MFVATESTQKMHLVIWKGQALKAYRSHARALEHASKLAAAGHVILIKTVEICL